MITLSGSCAIKWLSSIPILWFGGTLVLRQYWRLQFLLLQFSSGINIRFFDNFQISSMFESSFVTIFKWQMFFCCKSPCTRLSQFWQVARHRQSSLPARLILTWNGPNLTNNLVKVALSNKRGARVQLVPGRWFSQTTKYDYVFNSNWIVE